MKIVNKIEDHKTLFVDKDQYLEFRKQWKAFINSGKGKKRFEERTFKSYETGHMITEKIKVCDLQWKHHILYALFRGKDMRDCFKPSLNTDKKPSQFPNEMRQLKMMLDYIVEKPQQTISVGWLEDLRKPFGESLTLDMIKKLQEYLKDNTISNA
jgi:hypothetical protein